MERCGFAAKGLFVMDGSRRSAHANAYFTGFGTAKRVVFYDTLLRQLSVGEVEAVLAHELGHFKHRHIIQRIVSMFAFSLLGFALLGWLSTQSWFYTGLGVYPAVGLSADWGSAPNDALALLLFMLATPVFTQFISPLFSQLSRKPRVPGRCLRRGTNAGSRPGFSAAQAVRRQRLHPDPRPGLREVLLLTPTRLRAAGTPFLHPLNHDLHVEEKRLVHPDPPCAESS